MAESVKKAKAPAKPRKTATGDNSAAAVAAGNGAPAQKQQPARQIQEARSQGSHSGNSNSGNSHSGNSHSGDSQPSRDQISELARKYWAERGYTDGHHEEDWLRAERELRGRES